MVTSVKELKTRLREFLADASKEEEFREWFAQVLRDSHKSSPDAEALAHEVMWTFVDYQRGVCTSAELSEELNGLATGSTTVYFGQEAAAGAVTTDAASTTLQDAETLVLVVSRVETGPLLVYA